MLTRLFFRGRTRAIADEREARAEEESADDVRADSRRLEMEVRLGEVVQYENADHAHDDGSEHNFGDGPILKQQLAD